MLRRKEETHPFYETKYRVLCNGKVVDEGVFWGSGNEESIKRRVMKRWENPEIKVEIYSKRELRRWGRRRRIPEFPTAVLIQEKEEEEMEINFSVDERENFTLVSFELSEAISPEILKEIKPPEVNLSKGVVISGRGPIWLYSYLVHHYHPATFVATHDPRQGGAIVVQSHVKEYKEGDVIKI